jgi:hypothetical protein
MTFKELFSISDDEAKRQYCEQSSSEINKM